jgi:hypothetical protein
MYIKIPEAFRDHTQVVKLVKTVYFDYVARKAGF